MRIVEGETIYGRGAAGASYGNLIGSDLIFQNCYIPDSKTPGTWTSIENVNLKNSAHVNCTVNTTIIRDVSIHNLKRHGSSPVFVWSSVFQRVKMSGKISGLKINKNLGPQPGRPVSAEQAVWDGHVRQYYANVDWALDISEANFAGDVTFEAIPGDKIRRNPESQVLVQRDKLLAVDWQSLNYRSSALDISLSWFLKHSLFDSVVLVARIESKYAKDDVAVLKILRDAGVAELD